jgi:hypothetical protein
MKKEIPILFSMAMVEAILAGRKTQTRRILQLPKEEIENAKWGFTAFSPERHISVRVVHANGQFGESFVKMNWCAGDLLYVREGYYQYGKWGISDKLTKKGKLKRVFIPLDEEIIFATEGTKTIIDGAEFNLPVEKNSHILPAWYKRLPRFMPKKYARIWLQVEEVRVERLQYISEEDAKAEGVQPNCEGKEGCPSSLCKDECSAKDEYFHYMRSLDDFPAFSAKESFESLWEKINGRESWEENPWVWVVEFKVISTNGKPNGNDQVGSEFPIHET